MVGASFDIHVACDDISLALASELMQRGFTCDSFIGGTGGVIKKSHFSYHPSGREELAESWRALGDLLAQTSRKEFYGYAEAEVVGPHHCTHFTQKPFDPRPRFPFARLDHEECPLGRHKDFDFHISADLSSIDLQLRQLLETKINFYHVDIRKPSGRVVRVYTFQPMGVQESVPLYYKLLLSYFEAAGGFAGKVQLESTYGFERFPSTASVPPIVTSMPRLL